MKSPGEWNINHSWVVRTRTTLLTWKKEIRGKNPSSLHLTSGLMYIMDYVGMRFHCLSQCSLLAIALPMSQSRSAIVGSDIFGRCLWCTHCSSSAGATHSDPFPSQSGRTFSRLQLFPSGKGRMHLTQVSTGLFNSKWPLSSWLNAGTIHRGKGKRPCVQTSFQSKSLCCEDPKVFQHALDWIVYLEKKFDACICCPFYLKQFGRASYHIP